MYKTSLAISTLISISFFSLPTIAHDKAQLASTTDPLVLKSRTAIKPLAMQLKQAMQGAMKSGGPIKALSVCQAQAPIITNKINTSALHSDSTQHVSVTRTSLKVRNLTNAPDKWELKVLQQFESDLAAGKRIKNIEYSETVMTEQGETFRYMKAIPTKAVCLKCHGSEISADIQKKIAQLYPEDKAVGFKQGDIRGAFSTKILLSNSK